MEFAQQLLTAAAEIVAFAGITGIFAHALYTQHKNFMTEFCPAVKPYQPEIEAEEAPAVVEAVEVEQPAVNDPWTESEVEVVTNVISFQPVSRHFSPQLALPAESEVKQALKATTRKPRTKKAQPLAEELGLTPPSDWGKVQKAPAKTRTPRKRKTA